MGDPGREMIGATNIILPLHTHAQACTSAESFVAAYTFFNGKDPVTTDIVPEPQGQVRLAGRAILYQQNVGVQDATLQIWEVNGDTGARIHNKPQAIYPIGGDGAWGPFKAKGGVHYEFALLREGQTHHFYYQPFLRSDYFIRLTTSPVGGGIGAYTETSDVHTSLNIIRYKEIWGDQGVNNDTLTINGVNVATASICPIERRVISLFAFHKGTDGVSTFTTPFLSTS